jgi:8-oxo-dGTP pyrophosphatase MutT (NUDIX family)
MTSFDFSISVDAHNRVTLTDATTRHATTLPIEAVLRLASGLTASAHTATQDSAPHLSAHLRSIAAQLDTATDAFNPRVAATPAYWHPSPYRSSADWPTVPATVTKRCDNHSVGVLITDPHGRVLMFERATLPAGIAPPAGHIDTHGDAYTAAITEVTEETGLTVTGLTTLTHTWRNNVCRRQHGPHGPGHQWTVYTAHTTTGELNLDPREARNARWYTPAQLQALAERTVAYANGHTNADDNAAHPGIEPVWVEFLHATGLIHVSPADLMAVDQIASRSPYTSGTGSDTAANTGGPA